MHYKTINRLNKKNTAFSIAEALMSLAIVGIALSTAAPLISKTMKHNAGTDIALQHLQNQIDDIKDSQVPKGTVAFFHATAIGEYTGKPCPKGWSAAPTDWDNRFFKAATSTTRNELQDQSIQEHWHNIPALDLSSLTGANWQNVGVGKNNAWVYGDAFDTAGLPGLVQERVNDKAFAGKVFRDTDSFIGKSKEAFPDTTEYKGEAPSVSNDNETRPKNVALLVCIKD